MSHSAVHIILAFFLLLSLIFLNLWGLLNPLLDGGRLMVRFLNQPTVKVLEQFKIFLDFLVSLKDLSLRNGILERQVQELSAQVASLEKSESENRALREALGFLGETSLPFIPAEVIAWDPFFNVQTATLNRGEKHNVKKGDPVIIAGKILVGVISGTSHNTSQMDFITASEVVVNAEVVPTGARGVVRGEHGLGLLFDLISQGEILRIGDKVVSSGLGGKTPRNLLIGEIGKIRTGEGELFQKTNVIPAANLKALRFVFIIPK